MKGRGGWTLVHKETGVPVAKDDIFDTRDGEVLCTGGVPPHKPSSCGFVTLTDVGEEHDNFAPQYYASVIKCEWRRDA